MLLLLIKTDLCTKAMLAEEVKGEKTQSKKQNQPASESQNITIIKKKITLLKPRF